MIANSITQTIGNTPLVHLSNIEKKYELNATILAKLEFFNPGGSIKDRIAYNMIVQAEKRGDIKPGTTIIEPTSGNTGVGLAMVCAAKGYNLVLTMPESMSIERRKLLTLLGANLVLTPKALGMQGAVDKAMELVKDLAPAWMPNQFANPDNPLIHQETTAMEIWNATMGELDIFVSAFGTSGTITGCAKALKKFSLALNKKIEIVGVEPESSPLLSKGVAGPHKIQGIGANFIPPILEKELIDTIITIDSDDAINMAMEVAKTQGILAGISSGAALQAAINLAKDKKNSGKKIVVIFPDTAERYLSVLPIATDFDKDGDIDCKDKEVVAKLGC